MGTHVTATWQQRFVAELRAEKKKAIILAVLAVVGAVVVGRQMIKTPARASAAVAMSPQQSLAPAPAVRQATNTTSEQARRDDYLQRVDRTITRDLFSINYALFPQAETAPPPVEPVRVDSPEMIVQAVNAQAAALSLQSTASGASPTAIINGTLVHVGETIGEFTVVSISADSCELEKQGVRVVRRLVD